MFGRAIIGDGDVERLAEVALTVLERIGLIWMDDGILNALRKAGAQVDFESKRALFPREMVREFVEGLRRKAPERRNRRAFLLPCPGWRGK